MKKSYLILIPAMAYLLSCNSTREEAIKNSIPSLDEVSGVWMSADTADMEPSIRNFRGQALLNRDMTSISWFVSAPYSGGYHTGVLRIDDQAPRVSMFRWLPHQAIRKGELDKWKLFSTVKMVPDEDAIMWQVDIVNDSSVARELNLTLDLIGFISKYSGDWQWWYPYPKLDGATTIRDEEVENVRKNIGLRKNTSDEKVIELIDGKPTPTNKIASWPSDEDILTSEKYSARMEKDVLIISDTETKAFTSFRIIQKPDQLDLKNSGGTASWSMELNANEGTTISFLMSYGDNEQELLKKTSEFTSGFDSIFASIPGVWEERWSSLFKP